jgi:L-iditol 2-dehydrogenase
MKALVKFGQRPHQLELRDVPEPRIGPNDVLLQVCAAGICGWDIEMWEHTMANPVTVPVIQGHEFAGVIQAVGEAVTDWSIGERVVSETAAYICGNCPQCRTGHYNLCRERKGFGYAVDGAFTDLVCVPKRCLHRIPENVPFDHACITEPACVAYHALVVLSDLRPARPVLVIGPGPVGLFALQIAKAAGAAPAIVVGTEKDSLRLDVARGLGADVTVNASSDDPAAAIENLTAGQGVPLVVDAAGNEKALSLALRAVARGGQITKIGWGPRPVNLSLDPLLSKSVRLQGTFSHTWPTWEAVLRMIAHGSLQIEPMITHRVKLDQWLETFQTVKECRAIKAVFTMGQKEQQ